MRVPIFTELRRCENERVQDQRCSVKFRARSCVSNRVNLASILMNIDQPLLMMKLISANLTLIVFEISMSL